MTAFTGQSVLRVEDDRLLRGLGTFVDDLDVPGTLHAHFVRSPYPCARIASVDLRPCLEEPGVAGAWSGPTLALPSLRANIALPGYRAVSRPILATDRVAFVGEPVAIVLAGDRYQAEDGADRALVEYEALPALVEPKAAMAGPAIHPEAPDNVLYESESTAGDTDAAFRSAACVVEAEFRFGRCASAPMEGRAILVRPDPVTGELTVWVSTQSPHMMRTALAEHLGYPESRIRIIAPDMGGGFGSKIGLSPEELAVASLALRLGRPVKWVEDRRENLMAFAHSRDHVITAALAVDADGRILALRSDLVASVGAYPNYPLGGAFEALNAAGGVPGPYKVPACHSRLRAVLTHTCPMGAYRGIGQPVGTFAMERLLDMAAARCGLDPAEVRRRNLVDRSDLPYRSVSGSEFDSGSFHEALAAAMEAVGYAEIRAQQAAWRKQGRFVGVGLCSCVKVTGVGSASFFNRGMRLVPGYDTATVSMEPDGQVTVAVSTAPQGQGHETTLAQLAADQLGVPFGAVRVIRGDTGRTGYGTGTFASKGAVGAGNSLLFACEELAGRLRTLAAEYLACSAADVELKGGRTSVRGAPDRGITLGELARFAYGIHPDRRPATAGQGLTATAAYDPPPGVYPNGTHAVVVEVNPETGEVRILRYVAVEDCGTVINPMIVKGQIVGGVAQGLGSALLEELVYDESGQFLTASFMDYLLPTVAEMPPVEPILFSSPALRSPNGFKGIAELATTAATAAIANAVADAIPGAAERLNRVPLTPERVRQWFRPDTDR